MSFTLLLVGAGDVGRTVLAQALLEQELLRCWPGSADAVEVVTAGVDALDGMPPAPHLETVAAARGLVIDDHRAASLTRTTAEAADLVLAMTRRQRAQVVLQYPHLRPRTFALVEFAVLLGAALEAGSRTPVGRGGRADARLRLATAVAAAESDAVASPVDDGRWDVADPYTCGLDVYESVAELVHDVVRTIVADVALVTGSRSPAATRSA